MKPEDLPREQIDAQLAECGWIVRQDYEYHGRAGVAVRTFILRPGQLQPMPELFEEGLWPAQIVAIRNLERSLSQHRPSALIKMATGSGKTFSDFRAVRASQDGNTDIGLDFG